MFHTQTHIDSIYLKLFGEHPEIYDELFNSTDAYEVSIPFEIDTKWNYHPDEMWKLALSKELISLGAKEGQTIYIDY